MIWLIGMMLGVSASELPLSSAQTEHSPSREFRTKVGRSSYRILVDDGVVSVWNKAIIAGRSMDDRDRRRVAVRQATGCDLVDELWFDATLRGKLSCPNDEIAK